MTNLLNTYIKDMFVPWTKPAQNYTYHDVRIIPTQRVSGRSRGMLYKLNYIKQK